MINYDLINECLKCVPALVGCFIACLFIITIALCALLFEKVFCSMTIRKHNEKLNDVSIILKELDSNGKN